MNLHNSRDIMRLLFSVLLVVIFFLPSHSSAAERSPQEDFVLPEAGSLGVIVNTEKALPGYILFAPKHSTKTYLINNDGQVVHTWETSKYLPGQSVWLLENGHLLRCCYVPGDGLKTRSGEGGRIEEYDWDGNLVWSFDYHHVDNVLHHDITVMPNGNILMLAVERKSLQECLVAGFDESYLLDKELFPDYIIEVEPTLPEGGKIVWEWHAWDHLIQDRDPKRQNFGDVSANPGRIDVNLTGRPTKAFWNHVNSIDYHPARDEILLSVRSANEVWVIDHSTSIHEAISRSGGRKGHGGDLLYRWGNSAAYKRPAQWGRNLFAQHDARWLDGKDPSNANLLLFNNGVDRGYSSVDEIHLPLDSQGHYVRASGPWGPAAPARVYPPEKNRHFYSAQLSSSQRLPNGNTLICLGVLGSFVEIDQDNRVVWSYVNPVVGGGVLADGESPGIDRRGHQANALFSARKYPLDYPGLQGKSLVVSGVLEKPVSQKGLTGLHLKPPVPPDDVEGRDKARNDRYRMLKDLGYL